MHQSAHTIATHTEHLFFLVPFVVEIRSPRSADSMVNLYELVCTDYELKLIRNLYKIFFKTPRFIRKHTQKVRHFLQELHDCQKVSEGAFDMEVHHFLRASEPSPLLEELRSCGNVSKEALDVEVDRLLQTLPIMIPLSKCDLSELESRLEPYIKLGAISGVFEEDVYKNHPFFQQEKICQWFAASIVAEEGLTDSVLNLTNYSPPKGPVAEVISWWIYTVFRFLVTKSNLPEAHLLSEKEQMIRDRAQHLQLVYDGQETGTTSTCKFVHFAAAWGDDLCMKFLIDSCKSQYIFHAIEDEAVYYTALHLAAYYGRTSIVKLLLEADKLNFEGNFGKYHPEKKTTPLHLAAGQGYPVIVEALLEYYPSRIDEEDEYGMSPLQVAACNGKADVVRVLLQKGAKPDFQSKTLNLVGHPFSVNHPRVEWITKIRKTCKRQLLEMKSVITLEACFSLAPSTFLRPYVWRPSWSPGGFSALHFAVVYGRNEDTVQELLLSHPHRLATVQDNLGLSPFAWAKIVEWNGVLQPFLDVLSQQSSPNPTLHLLSSASASNTSLPEDDEASISSKAARCYLEVKRAEQQKEQLEWIVDIGKALLFRRWNEVRTLTKKAIKVSVTLDDKVWYHLQDICFSVLLKEEEEVDKDKVSDPLQRPACGWDYRRAFIERMMIDLAKGGAFVSISNAAMQSCLMWAIEEKMTDLVETIVTGCGNGKCDLISLVRGCDSKKSPLEAATDMAEQGLASVTIMEGQEEVRRRLYEDRQMYVDYANAILVGAVLIATLAYQGWVQRPQGYAAMSHVHGHALTLTMQRLFGFCSSYGFFFSMGALIAAAVGAVPMRSGRIAEFMKRSVAATSVASLLMMASVMCQVIGFAGLDLIMSASLAMAVCTAFGTLIVVLLLTWFLTCLHQFKSFRGILHDVPIYMQFHKLFPFLSILSVIFILIGFPALSIVLYLIRLRR